MARTAVTNRFLARDFGTALSFDGVDDYVNMGNVCNVGTNDFTIECWFKPRITTLQGLVCKKTDVGSTAYAGYACFVENGKFRTSVADGTNQLRRDSSTTLVKNQWYHVIWTWEQSTGTINIYLNGALDQIAPTGTAPTGTLTSTQSLYVGTDRADRRWFNGSVDQPRIWIGKLFSATEALNAYYAASLPTTSSSGEWLFNEGSGTTTTDSSGNGNDGTITGATYTSDVPSYERKSINANLVKNGDFEFAPPFTAAQTASARWIDGTAAGSTTNNLFGWYGITGVGTTTYQFDTDTTYNGKTSIKIDCDATGRGRVLNATFETTTTPALAAQYGIKVSPSTAYTLTAYCKTTTAASNSVYIDKSEYTGDGTIVGGSVTTSNKLSGTNDWTLLSVAFTTNATTRYVTVRPIINVAGQAQTAWFADISLTPTTPITRTAATGRVAV